MAAKAHLLIVDDEANTLASLSRAFRMAGYEATVCDSAARALELVKSQQFDLILSDVVMPEKDGLSLLEDFKNMELQTPVVMISGQAHIEMAVRATRLGAVDFLEKPLTTEKLLLTVENVLHLKRLREENQRLLSRLGKHEMVWSGEAMRGLMAQIERVAASETRVSILLDEIGDMPLAMQAKLLRVLEEGEIERVGGDHPVSVDVRVIVATHRNLEELVKQGKFRQDLYHRVYVFPLALPPLRARQEDVPALVDHFARQVAAQNGWKPIVFAPEAVDELKQYEWPGNVRELRNVVERLLLLATNDRVDVGTVRTALPPPGALSIHQGAELKKLSDRVEAFERETILAELRRHQNHITNTAHALGLERSYLYKKCQQLGIDLRALRREE